MLNWRKRMQVQIDEPKQISTTSSVTTRPPAPIDLGITGPTEFGTLVANAMSLQPGEWQFSQDCSTAYHDLYGVLAYHNGRLYHTPRERMSTAFQGRTDVGHNQRYLTIEDVEPIMEAWRAALTRGIDLPEKKTEISGTATAAKHAAPLSLQQALLQQQQQQMNQYVQQMAQQMNVPLKAIGIAPSIPNARMQATSHAADAAANMFAGQQYDSSREMIEAMRDAGMEPADIVSAIKNLPPF